MAYEQTDITVEWDHDHAVVLAHSFKGGEPQSTGIERQGGRTEWLPLVRDHPPNYIPGQARLLGAATYHLEGGQVVATYPDADFSPEAFRDNARLIAQERGQQVLAETDWYVIRWIEKNVTIPDEVKKGRDAVRSVIDAEVSRIETMAPAELQDYDAIEVNNVAKQLRDAVTNNRRRRS